MVNVYNFQSQQLLLMACYLVIEIFILIVQVYFTIFLDYVLDQKNGLLAEVIFNAGNKGFFGSKDNPDILTADIYQLTPAFLEAFLASKRTISPKKDEKNKLLASITGEWNGRLLLGE